MDRLQVELIQVRRQLQLAIDEASRIVREREAVLERADEEGVGLSSSEMAHHRRVELLSLGRATALTWAAVLIDEALARSVPPRLIKGTDRLVSIGPLPGERSFERPFDPPAERTAERVAERGPQMPTNGTVPSPPDLRRF
jgi:hypothetical protein